LLNSELGIKTIWAGGRVKANLTYYDMKWKDYQLQVLDPSYANGEPWQQVTANVGDAKVNGVQVELDWAMTDAINVGMNMVSLDSRTSTDVSIDDDPSTVEIPSGTRLPLAPEFKASGWFELNWESHWLPGQSFARVQYSYTGDSVNQIAPASGAANQQRTSAGYGIADFRMGIVTPSQWGVDLFVSNLTDERAAYTRASGYFEEPFSSVQDGRSSVARIYTNRPREYGIRVSKRFGN
jgi:outer membrane receptor for ferric coprogen and ferric-rhodotorulic acid